MLLISGIRLELSEPNEAAIDKAVKVLGISQESVCDTSIKRLSYDTHKGKVTKVYSVLVSLRDTTAEKKLERSIKSAEFYSPYVFNQTLGKKQLKERPIIIGFGFSGAFAALELAKKGYCPIVFEQGLEIAKRRECIEKFSLSRSLDNLNNTRCGEGGSALFPSGSFKTNTREPLIDSVLETLVQYGADKSIIYNVKPFIDSSTIEKIFSRIKGQIIGLGGEIHFDSALTDILVRDGKITGIYINGQRISVDTAIFATGLSSGELLYLFYKRGADISSNTFGIGINIEHLQSDINRAIFGSFADFSLLPQADYSLSTTVDNRTVYTYNMCPKGEVVLGSTRKGMLSVTSGMNETEKSKNAVSTIAVSINSKEYKDNPLASLELINKYERDSFLAGGGTFSAPASDIGSFLNGTAGIDTRRISSSYILGVSSYNLEKIMGKSLSDTLRMGIMEFSDRLSGFDSDEGILTGISSVTASPVKIIRDGRHQVKGIENAYACGSGFGYTVGAASAAVDGVKTAASIMIEYKPLK